MPKRVSLPSMLPPACIGARPLDRRPARANAGLPICSTQAHNNTSGTKITQHRGQDGPALPRVADHHAERVAQRAEITRIASSSKKFASGVGFSKGCDELTLKNPPPLVPNCLIAICEAAGPSGNVCSVTVLARRRPSSAAPIARFGTAQNSAPLPARPGTPPAPDDSGNKM